MSVLGSPLQNTTVWWLQQPEILFLPVLGAGRARSRCQRASFLLRPLSLAWRRPSSPRVLTWLSRACLRPVLLLQGHQSCRVEAHPPELL